MKKNKIVLFTLLLSIIGVVGSTKAASVNEESRSFRIENSADSELVQNSSSINNGKGIRFTNWTPQFQNFKKGDKIKILLPNGKFNGRTTTIRVYINGKLMGVLTLTYGEAYAVIVFNSSANNGDISQFISNFGAIGTGGIIDIGGGTINGGTDNASSVSSVNLSSMNSNRDDDNLGSLASVGSIVSLVSVASNPSRSKSTIDASSSSSSSKIISIPASSSSSDGKGISIHYPNGGPGPVIINSTMSAWKGSGSQSGTHGVSSSSKINSISSTLSSSKNNAEHDNSSSSSMKESSIKSLSSSSESIDEGKGIHRHSWYVSSKSELSSHHHHHDNDHDNDDDHHTHHHHSSMKSDSSSVSESLSRSSTSQNVVVSKSDSHYNDYGEDKLSIKDESLSSKKNQNSESSNVSRESHSGKEDVKVIVVPGKGSNNSSSSHLSLSKKSSSEKRSSREANSESSKKMAMKSPVSNKRDRHLNDAKNSQPVVDQNGGLYLTKQQIRQLQDDTRFESSKVSKTVRETKHVINTNNYKNAVRMPVKATIRNGRITLHQEKKETAGHSASHVRRINLPIRGILPATRMDKNTWLYSLSGLLIMIISGKELLDKKQK